MSHKPHPGLRVGAAKPPEPPLFTSDPRAKAWLKSQGKTTDERVAEVLAESATQTARRSRVYTPEENALWRTVKADKLKFPEHKPGFTSAAELLQHLGPKPEGAKLCKFTTREPHGPGNTFWGDAKGKPFATITEASRKAHAALRKALKAVPALPADLYRLKTPGNMTREQAMAAYELENKTRLLKPAPRLPKQPRMSAWENMQHIKRLTKEQDDEQVWLLQAALAPR